MWKYSSKNDYPNIILHDCHVTKISVENKDIILEFDDYGFWMIENNKHNPFGKTLRTDKSEIRFVNCQLDSISIYIFKVFHLFRKPVLTNRIEIPLENLMYQINSGKWRFEFIDEYYACNEALFNGWIRFDKKPYHMECQLQLLFEDMKYSWNRICEDKPW